MQTSRYHSNVILLIYKYLLLVYYMRLTSYIELNGTLSTSHNSLQPMEQIYCTRNIFKLTKFKLTLEIKLAIKHYNRSTHVVKERFIDNPRDTMLQ